jgi:nitroreductase
MELMDVIAGRRAVREFTDAAVQRPTAERLVQAAILAPSAMNVQPWAFAVLLDRARIHSYGQRIKSWLLENIDQTSFDARIRSTLEDPQYTLFHSAPALVLILAKSPAAQANEDCCLAAQNLVLAARNEGLGTCWIGLSRPWLNLPSSKRELGLPESCHVVAPIVLGYPKSWPESHGRSPAEIHWLT